MLTQELKKAETEFHRCQDYLTSIAHNGSFMVVERERKKGMGFFSRISKHIFR